MRVRSRCAMLAAICAFGCAAIPSALAAPDGVSRYVNPANSTDDCRFELKVYASSGRWSGPIAERACSPLVSPEIEQIAATARSKAAAPR